MLNRRNAQRGLLALAATICLAPALASAAVTIPGQPVTSSQRTSQPRPPRAIPLHVKAPAAYAHAKRDAAARIAASRRSTRAASAVPAPFAAVFSGLNASGLSAAQQIAGGGDDVTPPDTTGAIGPNHYMEIVNDEVAAYNRTSLATVGSPVDLSTFVGAPAGTACDPQVKYDPQTDRWFFVAIFCGNSTTHNPMYVGFSKTNDPTNLSIGAGGGWCGYSYDFGNRFEDYPKLGLDGSHVIIGANEFGAAFPFSFHTARIFSLPKPASGTITTCPATPTMTSLYTGSSLTTSAGNVAFTPQPATVSDSTSSTGYVIAADFNDPGDFLGNHLMLWHVGGTALSPTLVADGDVTVPTFQVPANVSQPGTSDAIDSMDGRLTQAVAAADPRAAGTEAVWTQHTVASVSGSVVRWYELIPSTMSVRQAGFVSDSAGFAFNGAIAPTLNGGAVINYNAGGSSQVAQIKAQSRIPSAPLNAMFAPITLASSSTIDSDFSCPSQPAGGTSCRWGDYAGASVDPSNNDVVWGSNQLNGPRGAPTPGRGFGSQWATENFALTADDVPPTASFGATPNPVSSGSSVSFNAGGSNDPDGSITTYSWDLGDGTSANSATTTHSYAAAGNYTVTLTVMDNGGKTGTAHQTVTVVGRPAASFSATPNPGTAGAPVSFNGAASAVPNGTITSYLWTFGDGGGALGAAPSHTYTTPGTYLVTLGVTDNFGQTATASRGITVKAPPLSGRVTIPGGQKVGGILKRGLTVSLSTSARVSATPLITTRIRQHHKLVTVTLLRGSGRSVAAGSRRITFKLGPGASRKLRGLTRVMLRLRLTLADSFGQKLTLPASVSATRPAG